MCGDYSFSWCGQNPILWGKAEWREVPGFHICRQKPLLVSDVHWRSTNMGWVHQLLCNGIMSITTHRVQHNYSVLHRLKMTVTPVVSWGSVGSRGRTYGKIKAHHGCLATVDTGSQFGCSAWPWGLCQEAVGVVLCAENTGCSVVPFPTFSKFVFAFFLQFLHFPHFLDNSFFGRWLQQHFEWETRVLTIGPTLLALIN